LTYSKLSACDSAPAYRLLYQLDDQRQSYDVISIFQVGGLQSQIYFSFRAWLCLTFLKVQSYLRTKFRLDRPYLKPRLRYYYFRFLKAATHLRCGGIFSDIIITNYLLILTVK